ncbi:MAG: GAF domain-containing protein [Chloroflexi bacterium]|nr:GAF domain-containing protein [Chloroflexota bacterium]
MDEPTPTGSSAAELAAQLDAVREVLRAISESPFDLEGVLGIVVRHMAKLAHSDQAVIFVPSREGFYRGVAAVGVSAEGLAFERENETPLVHGTIVGRAVLSGDVVQVEDTANDPSYTWEGQKLVGFRTLMGVPISKESRTVGAVGLGRFDVRLFDADEIAVVKTFADQAAIVIDNVRLLGTIESQREELARYLPSTVAELVSSPDGERLLAGHRREVTCVFCDLRGFTSFAEAAEPEEVLDILREYHRELGAIIVAHGGTLEHFAGDGMMIFLNDPTPIDDHVGEGVRMAVEMRDRFVGLADRWRRLGFDLGLGIGVSVGFATLGRIGFEGHLGYAVVGSVANLAARLCAVAEPGQIILSERALARVDSIATAASLGALELKGFRRPIVAYALTGLSEG